MVFKIDQINKTNSNQIKSRQSNMPNYKLKLIAALSRRATFRNSFRYHSPSECKQASSRRLTQHQKKTDSNRRFSLIQTTRKKSSRALRFRDRARTYGANLNLSRSLIRWGACAGLVDFLLESTGKRKYSYQTLFRVFVGLLMSRCATLLPLEVCSNHDGIRNMC